MASIKHAFGTPRSDSFASVAASSKTTTTIR
jgi:hypothetical protein